MSFAAVTVPGVLPLDLAALPLLGLGMYGIGMAIVMLLLPDLLTIRGTREGLFLQGMLIEWPKILDLRRTSHEVHVIGRPAPWNLWSGRLPVHGVGWPIADDLWDSMRARAGLME